MPPVAGRIAWARQLYEVIDRPMQMLSTQKHIINTAEGRKIVKNFNRMAAVLVEFEVRENKDLLYMLYCSHDRPIRVKYSFIKFICQPLPA